MAGDWIKAEKATPRKPEVLRIAAKLGIHPDHAFGLCFRFWSWCDDNLETGNAVGVTDVMLNALLDRDGVASALIEVGWLVARNGSLSIPNFDRHLSENAKNRALSAERTAKSRSKKCNGISVTKVLPEKRREEKSKEREKAVPFLETRSTQFLEAWQRWKLHSMDKGKPVRGLSEESQLQKLTGAYPEELEAIAAINHSIANNWANINFTNDHNRMEVSMKTGKRSKKDEVDAIIERTFGNAS